MGLDVGLTFGCRIKADLLLQEHEGCPACCRCIETKYCPTCGAQKSIYKTYKILDTETADKLYLSKCYGGDDGYRYITDHNCIIASDDNPRAGDMMLYRAYSSLQDRFIKEKTESVKKAFGIDLKTEDFGYFISMSY